MKSMLARIELAILLLFTRSTNAFLGPLFQGKSLLLLQATTSTSSSNLFPNSSPPFLAVITEPDACETDDRLEETLEVLQRVLRQTGVDLVSVRVQAGSDPNRVVRLVRELVQLATTTTRIVVSSDWVEAALQGGAHGIHVKESHRDKIPEIQQRFATAGLAPPLIGTSAHSVDSAIDAVVYHDNTIDYFFVGTCYPTQTHPEKTQADLEGPELPGQIAQAIVMMNPSTFLPVLAIGGINDKNCAEPVQLGASGVATIRAVLQAKDPVGTVEKMNESMAKAYQGRTT